MPDLEPVCPAVPWERAIPVRLLVGSLDFVFPIPMRLRGAASFQVCRFYFAWGFHFSQSIAGPGRVLLDWLCMATVFILLLRTTLVISFRIRF